MKDKGEIQDEKKFIQITAYKNCAFKPRAFYLEEDLSKMFNILIPYINI